MNWGDGYEETEDDWRREWRDAGWGLLDWICAMAALVIALKLLGWIP